MFIYVRGIKEKCIESFQHSEDSTTIEISSLFVICKDHFVYICERNKGEMHRVIPALRRQYDNRD